MFCPAAPADPAVAADDAPAAPDALPAPVPRISVVLSWVVTVVMNHQAVNDTAASVRRINHVACFCVYGSVHKPSLPLAPDPGICSVIPIKNQLRAIAGYGRLLADQGKVAKNRTRIERCIYYQRMTPLHSIKSVALPNAYTMLRGTWTPRLFSDTRPTKCRKCMPTVED